MADVPETVTEAVRFLDDLGYADELRIHEGRLARHGDDAATHAVDTAVADHQFRFEGTSDPADEAIVLGITLPDWGAKGVLVSGYGPNAEPDEVEALLTLTRRRD